jgi:hypothetical protein
MLKSDLGQNLWRKLAPMNSQQQLARDVDVRHSLPFSAGIESQDCLYRGSISCHRKKAGAIRETLENNRADFPILNSGVVIVAREAEVEDAKRQVLLQGASIINGAQTKGVLEDYFGSNPEDREYPSVSFELIVADEPDLIANISIARNFQNRVDDLSIYGRHGLFDDLEKIMRKKDHKIVLRKRETDFGDEFLDTEKLVQVVTVLAPENVEFPSARRRVSRIETRYRTYAYRHRSRCLRDFADVMENPKEWKGAHQYFLTAAPDAWDLYNSLKGEQAFSSLQKVKGEVVAGRKQVLPDGVPDGIVFPMMSALSRFVETKDGKSAVTIPARFPWKALFAQAEMIFKTTADHNPQTMGKDTDCYVALHGVIEMYFAATQN